MAHPITKTLRPGYAGAIASKEAHELQAGEKALGKEALGSSQAAAKLERVSSTVFWPQTVQVFGSMIMIPVGAVVGRIFGAKAKTIVQAPLAGLGALDTTTLGTLHHLPKHAVEAFGAKAAENGAQELAAGAVRVARKLGKSGDAFAAGVSAFVEPVTASFSGAANAAANQAKTSGITGALNRAVASLAEWRMSRLENIAERVGEKIHAAHAQEAVGVFGRLKQVAGGAPVMASGSIGAVQPLLRVASAGNFMPSHATAIRSTIEALGSEAAKALDPSQVKRVSAISGHAEKLARVIDSKSFWQSAKSGGVGAVFRGIPAALGKLPVARALILTGVAAGSIAMLLRTKAENTHSGVLLNELAADVYGVDVAHVTPAMLKGANAPELLKRASQDLTKSVQGNWVAGAAQLAGEGMWLIPNMSMGPALLMGGMSGVVGDMVKTDNPYLNAYQILKAEASGKGVLKPEQKVNMVTMLVAASPSIAAHGGVRNKLAKPIAEQIIAEKLTPQQIVREIALPQAMELRAVKLEEAKTAAAKVEQPVAVNTNLAAANENTVKTDSPTKLVGAVQPQGRVDQHAVAANR